MYSKSSGRGVNAKTKMAIGPYRSNIFTKYSIFLWRSWLMAFLPKYPKAYPDISPMAEPSPPAIVSRIGSHSAAVGPTLSVNSSRV